MNHTRHHPSTALYLFAAALLLLGWAAPLLAQNITGEWEMTMDFGGRQSFAMLTIARNPEGALSGKWGSDELSNVKFEGNKLTFTRTLRFGDNEFTMNYTGTLENGKLTGLMSSDRGEFEVNGARMKPKPPAAGVWDLAYTIGDRDVTARLTVSEKADGTPDVKWTSPMGENVIANAKWQNAKVTFDRTIKFNDREFETTFEGTVQGDKLTGVSKSDMAEIPVTGTRFGSALIGKWELTVTSDRGTRTGMLRVFPDLTGRYEFFGGEIPIKDLKLEGNQVTFAIEMGFGDQTFRMDFKGTQQDGTLKGQMSSDRGTSEIVGKKAVAAATGTSALVGAWEFTRETQQGTRTNTLKIKPDMTATYSMRDNEVPVTDLNITGDTVAFKVTMRFGDREFPMEFKGKLEGATLKGEFTTSRGTREAVGKKVQ